MKSSSLIATLSLSLSLFASAGLAQTAPAEKKEAPKSALPQTAPKAAPQTATQPADKKNPAELVAPEMPADEGPGEMHKILTKAVGEWETKTKSYMTGEVEESTGKCVVRSLFDGRYTQVQYSGKMMGKPFQGMGLYGYDTGTKKFVSSWVDSMSTGIATGTGELSADKKTLTWTVEMTGPGGTKETMREVETFIDDNTSKLEMFMTNPADGKEMLLLEISYTRVKRDKGAKPAPAPSDTPKPETAAPAKDAKQTPASAPKVAPATTPKLANPK
ncbi:MAG: DUF1579 family protein [Tepidisphaera sp.]